jgi:hypothetical protein
MAWIHCWTEESGTYQFDWLQVKVGFPYNYVPEEDISLLENLSDAFVEISVMLVDGTLI